MATFKGDPSTLRVMNRRTVLDHIRRIGPVSRTKLAELTGLSPAAITAVTAELIEDKLLTERSVGEAGSSGGRRPIFIDIDNESHHVIGLKLSEHRLEGVVTDLSLQVLAHITEDLKDHEPARVVTQISSLCKKLTKRAKINHKQLIGIGIGLSGVIDVANGIALHAPLLGWHNISIAELVTHSTGLPTWVDNDANGFAAAERLFGHARHARNFIAVAIGRGVGAALVSNGEIHRGRNGGAGEFGHNLIQPNGRTCSCGRQGCLEAYTCETAIIAQYLEKSLESTGITIPEILELAASNQPLALEVLSNAGRLLGTHVAYLVNAFNPELIVIGGEGAELGDAYFEPMREIIRAQAFDGLASELPIIVVPWDKDDFTPWAQGAASLAVQSAFDTGAVWQGHA